MAGESAPVTRSDDGDYHATAHLGDGRMLRFSPDGVFQDGIGRRDEGPGEYDLPVLMAGSADDLTILDVVPFRLTTLRGGEVETTGLPVRGHTWAVFVTAGTSRPRFPSSGRPFPNRWPPTG